VLHVHLVRLGAPEGDMQVVQRAISQEALQARTSDQLNGGASRDLTVNPQASFPTAFP
jgi:hypothetical protein